LCEAQACFRARLTPKPWRCGLGCPPKTYPWINDEKRREFEAWAGAYDRAIAGFAVCRLMDVLGETAVHPDVEPVLRLHDAMTCTASDKLA